MIVLWKGIIWTKTNQSGLVSIPNILVYWRQKDLHKIMTCIITTLKQHLQLNPSLQYYNKWISTTFITFLLV
jgi:hypothetical protein